MLTSEAGQLEKSSRQALRTPGTMRVPLIGRESSALGHSSLEATHVLYSRDRNMHLDELASEAPNHLLTMKRQGHLTGQRGLQRNAEPLSLEMTGSQGRYSGQDVKVSASELATGEL